MGNGGSFSKVNQPQRGAPSSAGVINVLPSNDNGLYPTNLHRGELKRVQIYLYLTDSMEQILLWEVDSYSADQEFQGSLT